jgi:peptidoglycan/xylan/chitin deacetylase (PgdA/CDA1 family)
MSADARHEPGRESVASNATSMVKSSPVLTAADVQEIHHVSTSDPVFFITVDDGNKISPELARYLDATHLPVTTFFIAWRLKQYKSFWLARSNVTYENHSLTHTFMGSLSLRGQIREICGASRVIKSVTDESPRFFRPPGGSRNKTLKTALARCGIKYLVMWKASAAHGILHTWNNRPLERGDIVLLHAIKSLPQTLKVVMDAARKQGLRPALLRDYLK